MSIRSDLEHSESESSHDAEDLEVQLYSLVHYATDFEDGATNEDICNNQQSSVKENQANSTDCAQNPSKESNGNINPQPTKRNESPCTKKDKPLKKKSKKQQSNVVDYLTLLKEYKTARAERNFAEMSRNPSLMWFHKQQDFARSGRKRYWMKEAIDPTHNSAMNQNSESSISIFNNSLCSSGVNTLSAVPDNAEAPLGQHFNGCTAPDYTDCDGISPPKRSRYSLDTVVDQINHKVDNYEIPCSKKKKKKRKKKKQILKQGSREIRQHQVQENHSSSLNHTGNASETHDNTDSRYNIIPSTKEADDVIVLISSDSESSVIMLGTPPSPEPPPVICLDSDNEHVRQNQEAQELVLNVTNPKKQLEENAQAKKDTPCSNEIVAANSSGVVKTRMKGLRKAVGCHKWTAEMMSFYNESWGGEHFDAVSLQRQMSNNPEKWRISYRDFEVGVYKKRENRKCTNCSQFGHAIWHCPEPPRPVCCTMCGELGHTEPRCPFPICLQCGERTKVYVRNCKNCRNKTYCTACDKLGHSADVCPEVWRRYCAVTSSAHVWSKSGPVYKPKEQQWCCACAKKGHLPEDCQPFFIEPISFQNSNGLLSSRPQNRKKNKYYTNFRKKNVLPYFHMQC